MNITIEVEKNGKSYTGWCKTEKIFASTIQNSIESVTVEIKKQVAAEYGIDSEVLKENVVPSNAAI